MINPVQTANFGSLISLVPMTPLGPSASPNPMTMANSTNTVGEDIEPISIGSLFNIAVDDPTNSHSMIFDIVGIPTGYTVNRTLTGATTFSTPSAGVVRFEGQVAADVVTSVKSVTLSITSGGPAVHSDRDFVLALTATTVKAGGSTHVMTATHAVNVRAIADSVDTTIVNPGSRFEDSAAISFPITVSPRDVDGSETIQFVDVFTVSTAHHGIIGWNTELAGSATPITNGIRFSGSLSQIAALLLSVTVTPLLNNGSDIQVRVSTTTEETNPTEVGDVQTLTRVTTINFTIDIIPGADSPTVVTPGVGAPYTGEEDVRIKLSGALIGGMPGALTGALTDADGSETLSFRITGAPTGAQFWTALTGGSAVGTNIGGGTYNFTAAQIAAGIFYAPPSNASNIYNMQFVAISTDTGGATTSTSAAFRVVVDAQADQPIVSGSTTAPRNTQNNFGININTMLTDTDGSEYISAVTISAFQTGWTVVFTPNANVTVTGSGVGPYTLSVFQASHAAALQTVLDSFRATPPTNFVGSIGIGISATSTDTDGSTAVRSGAHTITVT